MLLLVHIQWTCFLSVPLTGPLKASALKSLQFNNLTQQMGSVHNSTVGVHPYPIVTLQKTIDSHQCGLVGHDVVPATQPPYTIPISLLSKSATVFLLSASFFRKYFVFMISLLLTVNFNSFKKECQAFFKKISDSNFVHP